MENENPYFCFITSMIGVTVTDAWKIYRWSIEGGPNRSKISKNRHCRDWGISILKFAESVASAILHRYKPNVTNMSYIDGNLRAVSQVELEERTRLDDRSVEVVPNLNGKVVEPDVQSISSTEVDQNHH